MNRQLASEFIVSRVESTWPCPNCGERIPRLAARCRYCGVDLEEDGPRREPHAPHASRPGDEAVRWLIPIDRSGWAIASGYCGLLACFPFIGLLFGIVAIVTGVLALQHTSRNRRLGGQGRAIFGIVAGSIAGLGNAILILVVILSAIGK